ncbi:hypothetical protein AVEN_21312-1 [Araneus ventricosus]|uniref:Uncharacterized protein n=1 Tax=Araneus ventricosus TaxID=182803 RepID=A0A4Y2J7F8_ARAVE|nr:hypothetical protein AVEN_21312-1 [Araneus ventricosus]
MDEAVPIIRGDLKRTEQTFRFLRPDTHLNVFLTLSADTPRIRNELGDDSSFTEWSEWSKCNFKCKQSRKRECVRPEICEENVQRNVRNCKRSQCRQRMQIIVHRPEFQNERRSKEKLLKAVEPIIYGQWSNWSPCDSSCYTKRTKRCTMPGICNGMPPKEQYKECYVGGDECEKRYLERKIRNSTDEEHRRQILEDSEHPLDHVSCGIAKVPGQSRITGGRRVMKGSWPWQGDFRDRSFACSRFLEGEWAHGWCLAAARQRGISNNNNSNCTSWMDMGRRLETTGQTGFR